MNIRRKNITAEQRAQIISESCVPGCIISKVARSYGISEKTLYGWRSRGKFSRRKAETSNNTGNKFVELLVQEREYTLLKKAELTFSNFSLLIEGNISSTKLLEIVKILDGSC
ncbi:transposase [Rickettsia endosymbiont of Polydrusus tereticollis]|uniref:transposase n=1 Tax=Rickettsia endosymbiont of Polydrusus tereticollis TaxID=3066251 RepID=UPI0031333875